MRNQLGCTKTGMPKTCHLRTGRSEGARQGSIRVAVPGSQPGADQVGGTFYVRRYRADLKFRLELDYCGEQGIPHSWLLGGENRWTDNDRAKWIAWKSEQANRCPRCGTFTWEWQDPDTHEPVRTWEADVDMCQGCFGIDTVAASMRDSKSSSRGQRPRLFYIKRGDLNG